MQRLRLHIEELGLGAIQTAEWGVKMSQSKLLTANSAFEYNTK